MRSSLFHELLDTPNLKLLLQEVEQVLGAEAQKRSDFYEWLSPDVKAEFINGEIIRHLPAKKRHLRSTKRLFTLLENYVTLNNLGEVDTEKAMIALTRNDYEPDICFWRKETADTFDEETMRHPAPDLVVEVLSKSTEHRDRGIKFQDYAAHGVSEYWIIDPFRREVEAHALDLEFMQYESVKPLTIKDQLSSKMVEGFDIPVRAIFELEAYQKTLQSLLRP